MSKGQLMQLMDMQGQLERLGVFITSGPGATNLVTGNSRAYMDSVPMVAITGNVARNSWER